MAFNDSILVKLGLKTTEFNQGLSKSEGRAQKFSKAVSGAFMSIVGPVLAIGAVVGLGKAAITMGDEIDRAAQRTGTSIEEFQKLGYVAKQNKADLATLEEGIIELNKKIGESPEKFEKWGIAVHNANGTQKTSTEILAQVADAMKNAGTQAEKAAIAEQLLAGAGVKLMPMLQQGSENLLEMANSAESLSGVMSEDTVKALADAQQAMEDFGNTSTIMMGQAIGGARDLWKALKGEGLNEAHQIAKDLRKQAEQEVGGEFSVRYKASFGAVSTDGDKAREEAIEKRLNELTRERLETQQAANQEEAKATQKQQQAAETQAAWDEASAKAAKLDAQDSETKAKAEQAIANEKKLQEAYTDGIRKRELARAPIAEQIAANEKEINRLRALSEDKSKEFKERERAVAAVLALEAENLRLLEAQNAVKEPRENQPTEEDTEPRNEALETARADPTGKTVAGRNALRELKKDGTLSKNENEAFRQLTSGKTLGDAITSPIEATSQPLNLDNAALNVVSNENDRTQFEARLFKSLGIIEKHLAGKFINQ